MVEGAPIRVTKTEFTACFSVVFRNLYILRLALSAGIGGLLFGYDTGVISGALLYIKEDFPDVSRKTILQETIVATAVAGAIVGAGIGGYLSDLLGRKPTMMIADALFFAGTIVMATAPAPVVIILGRVLIGLGVGMASMTSPLYISETSPTRVRGALGSTNGLLITFGQFGAYLVNLGFAEVKGTWRWMLGVAAVPAAVQFVLMFTLPESPRWLFRKGRTAEAEAILTRIYPAADFEDELRALKASVDNELDLDADAGSRTLAGKLTKALADKVFRRGLYAGITVQVFQQFAGINSVMYYSPTIVQLAGIASKKTALALSLVTSGLNALGSVMSMMMVDRYGRRRLMMVSMVGIIMCLVALAVVFEQSADAAPRISHAASTHFGLNSTCPSYLAAGDAGRWNCMTCLKVASDCAFCAHSGNTRQPGACVSRTNELKVACGREHRTYFTVGCPSKFGLFAIILLGAYIIIYSPGTGTVPWVLNSEIYPLRYRGIGGGMAAVANWSANLVVTESFLTMTEALGSAGTFLVFAGLTAVGLVFIFFLVPETKGMPIEEVELMLEKGFKPSLRFCGGSKRKEDLEHESKIDR